MSSKNDLQIRLDSTFNDRGFKSAEASAKSMVRELDKLERQERQVAAMQMAAAREAEQRNAARLASMESLGRGFTAVGLLAAAGLGLAAKAASDWESAWTGVTKTVDGSAAELAQLEQELRGLAKTLPATHEEIAGVAEAAGQLGVKRQDVAAFTKTMIALGVSTNLSADDAATGLAKLGNIMGVLPSQAGRAGSALVALGNDGASTEADILAMSLRIAGAGRTIGMTEAQVMGFASALSSLGIEADAGGSSISRVMIDIAKAVGTGSDAVGDFARVAGMSVVQFSDLFRRDAAQAVVAFIEGLGGIQKAGGDVFGVLEDLGLSEIRVRDTLLRTAGASDLLSASLALGTQAWEDNLALTQEAEKRYATAESRVEMARNKINDAAISIGGTVLPIFAGAADKVGMLADGFNDLPGPVQTAVTVLGGLVAVIGLGGGAAMMAIPKYAALKATLETMGPRGVSAANGLGAVTGVLGGPWGLALAGATLALGAFSVAQGNARQAAEAFSETLDKQTGAATEASRAFVAKKFFENFDPEDFRRVAEVTGLTSQEIVDAYSNGGQAMDSFKAKWADLYAQMQLTVPPEVRGELDAFNSTLQGLERDTERGREVQAALKGALGDTGEQSTRTAGATKELSGGLTSTSEAAKRAQDEIDKLIDALDEFGGRAVNARAATREYESSLDDMAEVMKGFTAAELAKGAALDVGTEKGRKAQAALDDLRSAALKAAEASLKQGDDVTVVAGRVQAARDEFVKYAMQMRMSKGDAEALADKLGLTRENVDALSGAIKATPPAVTSKVNVDTNEANANAEITRAKLDRLQGYVAYARVSVDASSVQNAINKLAALDRATGWVNNADGNVLSFAAGGAIGDQSPQIQPNRGPRGIRWSEKGAGPWEAFISGDPGKRLRSRQIWEETGRRLGMSPDGGAGAVQVLVDLSGVVLTGSLDTPWGPAQVRGVVRDEVAASAARLVSVVDRRL